MANKQLIKAMKNMAQYYNMDKHVVQMFAAFVIALKENTNFSDDDIEYLLASVQEEWNKSVVECYDIADKCNTMYDFDVRRQG